MNVTCRCGQGFTLQAKRYPHRVACHVCGLHFNVWSDGSVIDLSENTLRATAFESAAIQTELVLSLSTAPSSTSFAVGLPDDANRAAATKLQADLRVIDLQWQSDRKLHSLVPVIGITILPSKMLSAVVLLIFIAGWGFLASMAVVTHNQGWLCPGTIGAAISTFLPVYIYKNAHGYGKAEAEWQRKRTLAIGKSSLPDYLVEEVETKSTQETS